MADVLWQLTCGVMGVLIMILITIGNRALARLDKISDALNAMQALFQEKHTEHEGRISRLETRCIMEHGDGFLNRRKT